MSTKAVVGNEVFLVACIKHAKEKMKVDFDTLAKDIGMSVGGARNKYNAIIKAIEEERVVDGDTPATATTKAPAKKGPAKRKTPGAKKGAKKVVEAEVEADDSSISEPETPKKKIKKAESESEDEGEEA